MKVLYFDCFSGMSGDMTIGAFLDAGVDYQYLVNELLKMDLKGYSLKAEKTVKNGLAATKFNVMDENGNVFGHAPLFVHCHKTHSHGGDHQHDHTHDHESDHRHNQGCEHNYDHEDDHSHDRSCHGHADVQGHDHDHGLEHTHGHDHDHGASEHHAHRGLREIKEIINSSGLNQSVKNLAVKIFENIAAAESKMHNIAVEEIHFHEVGAIDSIIDIVGTAICFDYLKIDKCYVSKIPVSFSFIKTAHGKWPNPAPASLELLKNFTLTKSAVEKELVTPTGAAIIKTLCDPADDLPPDFILEKIGYGAGFHDFEHPNVLRIMTGEKKNSAEAGAGDLSVIAAARELDCQSDEVNILKANIDDMAPEFFEPLISNLIAAGALDVSVSQILMKKGRPAFELTVISKIELTSKMAEIIFNSATTIGLRVQRSPRLILKRKFAVYNSPSGRSVAYKVSYLKGSAIRLKPEFEDLKNFAAANKISIDEARAVIMAEIQKSGIV